MQDKKQKAAADALAALDDAWAYFTPAQRPARAETAYDDIPVAA